MWFDIFHVFHQLSVEVGVKRNQKQHLWKAVWDTGMSKEYPPASGVAAKRTATSPKSQSNKHHQCSIGWMICFHFPQDLHRFTILYLNNVALHLTVVLWTCFSRKALLKTTKRLTSRKQLKIKMAKTHGFVNEAYVVTGNYSTLLCSYGVCFFHVFWS